MSDCACKLGWGKRERERERERERDENEHLHVGDPSHWLALHYVGHHTTWCPVVVIFQRLDDKSACL